jgi:hypothetical protein
LACGKIEHMDCTDKGVNNRSCTCSENFYLVVDGIEQKNQNLFLADKENHFPGKVQCKRMFFVNNSKNFLNILKIRNRDVFFWFSRKAIIFVESPENLPTKIGTQF